MLYGKAATLLANKAVVAKNFMLAVLFGVDGEYRNRRFGKRSERRRDGGEVGSYRQMPPLRLAEWLLP